MRCLQLEDSQSCLIYYYYDQYQCEIRPVIYRTQLLRNTADSQGVLQCVRQDDNVDWVTQNHLVYSVRIPDGFQRISGSPREQ